MNPVAEWYGGPYDGKTVDINPAVPVVRQGTEYRNPDGTFTTVFRDCPVRTRGNRMIVDWPAGRWVS